MNARVVVKSVAAALAALAVGFTQNSRAWGHCDGMDGPVVQAAQKALSEGNVNLVLIWVQPADEGAVKTAYRKTLAVRKLGPEAKDLADLYFFETVVRLHRAGEGAAYTGLKPAGRDMGPMIPAADEAIAEGAPEPLWKVVPAAHRAAVKEDLDRVLARKRFAVDDVEAGRRYVAACVTFMHKVEAIGNPEGHHAAEGKAMCGDAGGRGKCAGTDAHHHEAAEGDKHAHAEDH